MDNAASDTDDSRRQSRRSVAAPTSGAATSNAKRAAPVISSSAASSYDEEGCRVCRKDDNHANLLLCEACNDEYHTYCLNPPLESVPEGDFFCGAWVEPYILIICFRFKVFMLTTFHTFYLLFQYNR